MTSAQLTTAEWICTRCGATNRRLVPGDAADADDRCVTCRLRHHLTKGDRPVRWNALAPS
jgi:DNA-directed RNA polymerase subunit RPC12/RpoP